MLHVSPEVAWGVVMDWERQSRWMLFTRVWATGNGGVGVGGGVAARTSVGGVGFTDDMVITRWEPPRECTVKHLGKLVQGTGTFTIEPVPLTTSNTNHPTPHPDSPNHAHTDRADTDHAHTDRAGVDGSLAARTDADGAYPERAGADQAYAGRAVGGVRCRVVWREDVVPPFGWVGAVGWLVGRWGFGLLMWVSLRRLVREVGG
ncbi:SRPBCC family protein [Kribbella solani]|uniref:SRPBCC family protein n=1 Tax=Kribbella solani TaxID=236067 RepID=UPI0029AB72CD|nr:SRPBCC family protein [Kribbella solani]MDX3002812.1 SRPBCC family protein [Kribbella solani]